MRTPAYEPYSAAGLDLPATTSAAAGPATEGCRRGEIERWTAHPFSAE